MRDHGPDVIRKRNMLTVTTEQEKALYLRAFTAGVLNHTYGGWDVLPDSAYSGEYAGLLDWLDSKGFDPFSPRWRSITPWAMPHLRRTPSPCR